MERAKCELEEHHAECISIFRLTSELRSLSIENLIDDPIDLSDAETVEAARNLEPLRTACAGWPK